MDEKKQAESEMIEEEKDMRDFWLFLSFLVSLSRPEEPEKDGENGKI